MGGSNDPIGMDKNGAAVVYLNFTFTLFSSFLFIVLMKWRMKRDVVRYCFIF